LPPHRADNHQLANRSGNHRRALFPGGLGERKKDIHPSVISECCLHGRLSHKAVRGNAQRARGGACQSPRTGRPRDGPAARDGRDGRFRSPLLEAIEWPRRGFMRQPHGNPTLWAAGCVPMPRVSEPREAKAWKTRVAGRLGEYSQADCRNRGPSSGSDHLYDDFRSACQGQ
jgi:hypothetical protein